METLEIFAPIANRLGMHAFRIEFEDLGFATLSYALSNFTRSRHQSSREPPRNYGND